jgi:hypothetical protein
MAGWALRSPRKTLVGRLEQVYVSSGFGEDRDTNFKIVPISEYEELLINRHGKPNAEGFMWCEVQVMGLFREKFGSWINGLIGGTVIARGVWVDDTGHDDTTELHPLDLISGPVTSSISSTGDWIAKLAFENNKQVGVSLFAYRFAAASDTRDSLFFAGPPLAGETRGTAVTLDFPPQPAAEPQRSIGWKIELAFNAEAEVTALDTPTGTKLRIGARCKAQGDGGPGVVLGEAAAYWRPIPVVG